MDEIQQLEQAEHIWNILGRIFNNVQDTTAYTKSQWFESCKPNKLAIAENGFWLKVLAEYINDWATYVARPISRNWSIVKDLEAWINDDTIYNVTLHCITDTLFMVYGIDHEKFVIAFKSWIEQTKPRAKPVPVSVFDIGTEPFIDCTIIIHMVEIEDRC